MNNIKKRFPSENSSPRKPSGPQASGNVDYDNLSPELIPIVTLLSSQSHRRYQEGIFMLYYDLNGDGKPAERVWKEVYGILTGNQLAYWDAANLIEFRNNPEALLETSAKPMYINFTDSVYNAMRTLPAAKQNLDNVIIVSTTLKNRYIIQFKTYRDLTNWYCSLRLANYEYASLQEAYTGALLSARGSRLSDIRTILAEKRFDHEDWVSIRYGSGMAWKRCYAVVEPSVSKKKSFTPGRVLFYENDQKKKKQLMAVVTSASSVTAIYPQSHQLIDHSTMLKLDAYINFKSPSISTKVSKKSLEDFRNTSIFLMPEQHSSVPGFDTLVRFLIPLLDSFGLYGRPKRLKSDRVDPDSLLFGLPTLPHVHYLEVSDIIALSSSGDFLSWDVKRWTEQIKGIMKSKLDRGYEGCGSTRGLAGALSSLSSPSISSSNRSASPVKNQKGPQPPVAKPGTSTSASNRLPSKVPTDKTVLPPPGGSPLTKAQKQNAHASVQLDDIYHKYSTISAPSDQFHADRNNLKEPKVDKFGDSVHSNMRGLSLKDGPGSYPRNDNELFSDYDDDEDDDEDDDDAAVDSRQIGTGSDSKIQGLEVPYMKNRDSSYSSVMSPMAQYEELNQEYAKVAKSNGNSKHPMYDKQYSFSDSDEEILSESPPPEPPMHKSFDYGNGSQESLHGNEYRNGSPTVTGKARMQSQTSNAHKPKYITSPNQSQNALPQQLELSDEETVAPEAAYQQRPAHKKVQRVPPPMMMAPPRNGPPPQNGRPPQNGPTPASQPQYPQSSQFGYMPKPAPPQNPNPGSPTPQGQPQMAPQHPYHMYAQHPPNQYKPQPGPPPPHMAPRQYAQAGIPPSVSHNAPQPKAPHPYAAGAPPHPGAIPRQGYPPRNQMPPNVQGAYNMRTHNADQTTYRQAGIPPSVSHQPPQAYNPQYGHPNQSPRNQNPPPGQYRRY